MLASVTPWCGPWGPTRRACTALSWRRRATSGARDRSRATGSTATSPPGRMRPRVEAAFVPPRFTQANCHAEQFFAARTPGGWAVTGVVDMEVALGGWPLLDVAGIAAALSHPRFGGYRWWRPWFEGYGEPDIDLLRLALLTTGSGAARRGTMLRRLLASDTWDELLDVSALHPGAGRAACRR